MVAEQEASRKRRQQNANMFGGFNFEGMGMPGMAGCDNDGKEKGPRLFQAQRKMPLPQAFSELGINQDWLEGFKTSGEHYSQIRYAWRQAVLKFHPDRQPSNLSEEEANKNTAEYMKAMSAFESIDNFYALNHAKPVEALKPEAVPDPKDYATQDDSVSPRPTGSETKDTEAKPVEQSPAEPEGKTDSKAEKEPSFSNDEPKLGSSKNAKDATQRAARPLFLRRRVEVVGLKSKPEFNGKCGKVTQFDRGKGRYAVELDGNAGSLQVRAANLQLIEEEEETLLAPAEEAEDAVALEENA